MARTIKERFDSGLSDFLDFVDSRVRDPEFWFLGAALVNSALLLKWPNLDSNLLGSADGLLAFLLLGRRMRSG